MQNIARLRPWFTSFLDLFYPIICEACGRRIEEDAEFLCMHCQRIQPPTTLHLHRINEFTGHFRGRLQLHTASSLYYYVPGGLVHQLIEKIKYRKRPDLATSLGRYYGNMIADDHSFGQIDLVTSVPLHKSKQVQRGYNQSECFAVAVAESLGIQYRNGILLRHRSQNSLTAMDRFQRMKALQETYALADPSPISNRHVLLVDDVMTTGATLEACGRLLLEGGASSLSLMTIAMGH
ncbi:MAG: phosphoribosyltransferase family protein [Saprospiraceae bacterium]